MAKSCQFCTSEIPSNAEKCPKCGGMQIPESPIPPPSPYFESVMQPDPPEVSEPVIAPEIIPSKPYVAPKELSKANMATIGLILGLTGIPIGFMTLGCSLIMNAIGIFFSWMGLKSEKRKIAIWGLILNIGTIALTIIVYIGFAIFFIYGISQGN